VRVPFWDEWRHDVVFMRLITYATSPSLTPRIGVRVGHRVLDIETASRVDGEPLPSSMKALLREGRGALSRVQALARKAQSDAGRFAAALVEERAIRFLPPVPDPENLLCVGKSDRAAADQPLAKETSRGANGASKINACLVGHDTKVAIPAAAKHVGCEPELVFVIGRRALGVKREEAMDYAVGVTILSDLADRDLQKREPAANDAPGFAPLGPEIVTMDEIEDPYDLWLTCSVNGEQRMRVSTGEQIAKLPALLEHFSRTNPLEPGDMFSTGAARGAALGGPDAKELFLKPGDVVECSIEGVTTLRTLIVAANP